jgi:glycosyltransferase involved in cell wall biosynthesis
MSPREFALIAIDTTSPTKVFEAEPAVRPKVLLIAPVGIGVGGMIASANLLVEELRRQDLVQLEIIDSTQRYRDCCDLSLFSRVWGGSWHACKVTLSLLISLIKFRPDFVSIWSSASLGLCRDIPLCALARVLGARTHVSFHFGRIPDLAIKRNWEWRLLSLIVRIGTIVSVLDHRSLVALADAFPNRCICQNPNAVDLGWIDEIREKTNSARSKTGCPLLVFVGMALPSKGVVELVEACMGILNEAFELEIVGPIAPEVKSQLTAIAIKREGGVWLRFAGAVSNDEAAQRIASADVFVLPSYSEGFPRSALEAMALGVAIVATNVGAIPEMLQGSHGEVAGVIVPPRDTQSLRLAIEKLLQDPAKRSALGAAARKKCESSYLISDHARSIALSVWAGMPNMEAMRADDEPAGPPRSGRG